MNSDRAAVETLKFDSAVDRLKKEAPFTAQAILSAVTLAEVRPGVRDEIANELNIILFKLGES